MRSAVNDSSACGMQLFRKIKSTFAKTRDYLGDNLWADFQSKIMKNKRLPGHTSI
jgi:hypothetical protein